MADNLLYNPSSDQLEHGDWFYSDGKDPTGPLSWEQLKRLAADGCLQRTYEVWTEGMLDWVKAACVRGLFRIPPPRKDNPTTSMEVAAPPPSSPADSSSNATKDDSEKASASMETKTDASAAQVKAPEVEGVQSLADRIAKTSPGEPVRLTPGTYQGGIEVSTELTIEALEMGSAVSIVGMGCPALSVTSRGNLTVRGVELHTEGPALTSTAAVQVLNGRLRLEHCLATSSVGPGILVDGAEAVAALVSCCVNCSAMQGILFQDGAKGNLEECQVEGNIGVGAELDSKSRAVFKRCRIVENGDNGVHVHDEARGSFLFCTLRKNGMRSAEYPQILISDGGEASLEDCDIADAPNSGVEVESGGECDLLRGRVTDCRVVGISVNAGTTVVVRSTQIDSCQIAVCVEEGGSATLDDCTLENNGSETEEDFVAQVACLGELSLHGCSIRDGKSVGVWVSGGKLLLEDCEISGSKGVGISADENAELEILESRFFDNDGGGLTIGERASATLEECKLEKNGSETEDDSCPQIGSHGDLQMRGCSISDSLSVGVWAFGGKILLEDCEISGSKACGVSVAEKAMVQILRSHIFGNERWGVFADDGASATLEACKFEHNGAEIGEVLYAQVGTLGDVILRGCSICDSEAGGVSAAGGSVSLEECDVSNSRGIGVLATEAVIKILRSSLVGNEECGVAVGLGASVTCEDCKLEKNGSGTEEEFSAQVTSRGELQMHGCSIWDSLTVGVFASGGKVLLEECEVSGSKWGGVLVTEKAELKIRRCRIFGNLGNAIIVKTGANGYIEDTEIDMLGKKVSGVCIDDRAHCDLLRCRILRSGDVGVFVDQSASCVLTECEIAEHSFSAVFVRREGTVELNRCHLADSETGVTLKIGGNCKAIGTELLRIEKPYYTGRRCLPPTGLRVVTEVDSTYRRPGPSVEIGSQFVKIPGSAHDGPRDGTELREQPKSPRSLVATPTFAATVTPTPPPPIVGDKGGKRNVGGLDFS